MPRDREKDSHRLAHAVDERLGAGLDRLVRALHRARLHRLGWDGVLHEDSAASSHPPAAHPIRAGNSVTVHIDGADALAAIQDAISQARSSVLIAGWFASPAFRLRREPGSPEPGSPELGALLADVARRVPVRVLLWGGPPLPLFKPTRRMARAARDGFAHDGVVHCALDRRERTLHCHHEKLVIVDGRVAFVGGIDLTALAGDRWDSPVHGPRGTLGWHDVASELRGPIVADVAAHFGQRWSEVTGETVPPTRTAPSGGETTVQLVRTVPEHTYRFAPRGDFSLLAAYLRALRSARSLIYLENQFLWSTEVVDILTEKLINPPTDDFRILIMLPTRPNNGTDTTRGQLGRLLAADGGRQRFLAVTLDSHADGATGPLYVHAKVAIVDDAWLTLGSANLNEHSLFNDTEVNIVVPDARAARDTRVRLWSEHLQRPESQLSDEPARIIDGLWRPIATDQAARVQRGEPRTHRLNLLPNLSRHAERLQGPLRGLLVDG